ncbi:MAG TPA: hypothetical protein VN283_10130 [Thiobacillus sp.]|nr:hypothetical protein [Thiobacillus sp.]
MFNKIMDQQAAKEIATATDEVFGGIGRLLDVVNASCEGDTRKQFQLAIGKAIAELDLEILEPIYQQFPELRPPDMEEVRIP